MQIIRFDPFGGKQITLYGSQGATAQHLARRYRDAQVVCIALEPNGLLGRHAASGDQLFMVIAGQGEVSGDEGQRLPIKAGTAALWRGGEMHETRAGPDGLTALVVEGALDDEAR